jgi:uncharacterized damage-inducible protein DinB
MHTKLQHLFEKIESQRRRVLDLLKNLPTEQLNQKPSPEKWSASEVLSHLISAERLSIGYIKKKIQGVEKISDTGLVEEAKMTLLKVSQRISGLKFKAPKYVVENTSFYSDLPSLEKEWQQTRNELKQILETISERHLNRKIYKHAVVGYLNIQHAIIFFGEHVTHHTPQLKKLIPASR